MNTSLLLIYLGAGIASVVVDCHVFVAAIVITVAMAICPRSEDRS
jgi:hypothetical protein